VRNTTWNVTDLDTLDGLLNGASISCFGFEVAQVRRLDITLRLPRAVFDAVEEQFVASKDALLCMGDTAATQARQWLHLCLLLPRLGKLSKLRIWLDHDGQAYWAHINERAFVSPVVASVEKANVEIIVYLPILNPRLEVPSRHILDAEPSFTIIRRRRQKHHGYVNTRGRLFVVEKGDFPLLEVGGYPFEDMGKEELEALERELWKQGLDVQHEIVDRGFWKHAGGFDWDDDIDPQIVERERELGRSLKWTDG